MSARDDAEARLRGAAWLLAPETQRVFAALGGAEGRTRAVGGIVRDTILGRQRPDTDIDMATELRPEQTVAAAGAAGLAIYPTGIEHGTVTVRAGATSVEVTTLRQDVQTDGRHAVVAFGTDWAADAARRDFTINALYCGPDGTVFDPLGGIQDVFAGRVRFIGDADRRIAEDGLRVFRFFRFSASHGAGAFDAVGLAACTRAAGRLGHLSAERVGVEMLRLLALERVAPVLATMATIGLLPLDNATLERLERYERTDGATLVGRLAVLVDAWGVEAVQERWRLSNALRDDGRKVADAAALIRVGKLADASYLFGNNMEDAIGLAVADAGWTVAKHVLLAMDARDMVGKPFPLSGGDLAAIGFAPGAGMGRALKALKGEWLESRMTLDRAALLERARKLV